MHPYIAVDPGQCRGDRAVRLFGEPARKETPMTDAEGQNSEEKKSRTWIEEIEVKGDELVARVKQLAADNKVKRIRVIEPDGDIALEIPLTYGAVAGGAVVIAAPVLAVIGALAALVAKVKIEIVNEEAEDDAPGTADS